MRTRSRPSYAAGYWQGNQLRWRLPHFRAGQRLASHDLNLMVGAINGNLVPPRDLTEGIIDESNKLRFAPIIARRTWEGRVENPEDDEQYIVARNTTQILIRIQPEMLPIQANDVWIISQEEDGSIADTEQREIFDELVEDWEVSKGQVVRTNPGS